MLSEKYPVKEVFDGAKYIRMWCIEKGMHRYELAEKVGRSVNDVKKVLSGEDVPSIELLIKMCDVLGISAEDMARHSKYAEIAFRAARTQVYDEYMAYLKELDRLKKNVIRLDTGEYLKKRLREVHITQAELERLIGSYTLRTNNLVNGKVYPDIEEAYRLIVILEIDIDDFAEKCSYIDYIKKEILKRAREDGIDLYHLEKY